MNALLVAAEKHEREGGESPLRGQILVLCRATADITRIKDAGEKAFTPAELWAQAWPALQRGAVFVLPGVWYPLVLAAVACGLGFGFGSRGRTTILMTGAAALFTYLLAALGAFSTFGLLLPLTPSVATLWGGLLLGRFFARRREPISL